MYRRKIETESFMIGEMTKLRKDGYNVITEQTKFEYDQLDKDLYYITALDPETGCAIWKISTLDELHKLLKRGLGCEILIDDNYYIDISPIYERKGVSNSFVDDNARINCFLIYEDDKNAEWYDCDEHIAYEVIPCIYALTRAMNPFDYTMNAKIHVEYDIKALEAAMEKLLEICNCSGNKAINQAA